MPYATVHPALKLPATVSVNDGLSPTTLYLTDRVQNLTVNDIDRLHAAGVVHRDAFRWTGRGARKSGGDGVNTWYGNNILYVPGWADIGDGMTYEGRANGEVYIKGTSSAPPGEVYTGINWTDANVYTPGNALPPIHILGGLWYYLQWGITLHAPSSGRVMMGFDTYTYTDGVPNFTLVDSHYGPIGSAGSTPLGQEGPVAAGRYSWEGWLQMGATAKRADPYPAWHNTSGSAALVECTYQQPKFIPVDGPGIRPEASALVP